MGDPSRSVLVVDDLPEIADFFVALARRMSMQNVTLETETDPRRAIERIRGSHYDLVMSDFRMPHLDGIDVLKAALDRDPHGHRILMTGYNEIPTPVARIDEARVDAYVQKPLRVQDIMLLLLDFLHENEQAISVCRQKARELESLGRREEGQAT